MKISKKVREEAASICAVAASGGAYVESLHPYRSPAYGYIARELGVSGAARDLACKAFGLLYQGAYSHNWTRELDAEAEALIRTGWSPGDKP